MPDVTPIEKQPRKLSAETTRNKNRATVLHSKIVRAYGRCQWAEQFGGDCGGPLHCAHIIRRRYSATRTYLPNGLCLCQRHHTHVDSHALDLVRICDAVNGAGYYDFLQAKADAGLAVTGLSPLMICRAERADLTRRAQAMGVA